MRTNEEMLRAVHDRALQMRRARNRRRAAWLSGGATACALALLLLLAAAMTSFQDKIVSGSEDISMQASVLADSGALGYVVVGIVAFLLGVAVTLLCVMLRKWRDRENDRP